MSRPRAPEARHALTACLATLLFLFFFFRPQIDAASAALVFGMWAAAMARDLHLTFAHESLIPGYEKSIVLSFGYRRFPRAGAALLAVAAESACVVLAPVCILFEADMGASAAIAYVFAVLHACAIRSNEEFVGGVLGRHT